MAFPPRSLVLACRFASVVAIAAATIPFAAAATHAAPPVERRAAYPPPRVTPPTVSHLLDLRGSRPLAPAVRRPADADVDHIAMLEDDGSLVQFLGNGVFVTDTPAIVQRFYSAHPDTFDYLVILVASTYARDINPEAGFAFETNVANAIQGIGLPQFNEGPRLFPGLQRLQSLVNMNDLGEYGEDPGENLPGFLNSFSGITILGQEVAHRVGAYVQADTIDVLGRGAAHWSFFFQSYGSVLEGNAWMPQPDGSYTSVAAGRGYSELDLYLFGILAADEVTAPMYVIDRPVPDLAALGGPAALPAAGVNVRGTPVPVRLDDFVALHGPRQPDAAHARTTHSMAWILVFPLGQSPSAWDLEKIDDFRVGWEEFYAAETRGRGRMITTLGAVPVRADFEARVRAGAPGLTVQFDNDSFGSITGFAWDFGDGGTSSERHPVHTYTAPGAYTVRLTVFGEGGPAEVAKAAYVRVGSERVFFADDFESDTGWGPDPADDARTGRWLRGPPIASRLRLDYGGSEVTAVVQPGEDHTPGGTLCAFTGIALESAPVGTADVDDGVTTWVSPEVDLSGAADPVLEFWCWFSNNAGSSPGRDPLEIDLSNDGGATWVRARTLYSSHHFWRREQLVVREVLSPTARVRVRFRASDLVDGSIVEAAVDDVRFFDVDTRTPVVVEDLAITVEPAGVRLSWSLPVDARQALVGVSVQRSAAGDAGPFATLDGSRQAPAARMTWLDPTLPAGATAWYRLVLEGRHGGTQFVTLGSITRSVPSGRPTEIASASEYAGGVRIRYTLASPATAVELGIHDVTGRRVARLRALPHTAGSHVVVWDRRHEGDGARAARGVYFVRLRAGHGQDTYKLVLTRP